MDKDELREFLYGDMGMCGCGQPENFFKFLRDSLRFYKKRQEMWETKQDSMGLYEEYMKSIGMEERPGLAYWWMYWLDHVDLTEHGGCVPGWLTHFGVIVLEAMEEIGETEEEIEDFLDGH